MINEVSLRNQIQAIEQRVSAFLDLVATKSVIEEHSIAELEHLAASAAKLAYGNDRANFLSIQMKTLISWCDHLNEPEFKQKFFNALSKRPLVAPW